MAARRRRRANGRGSIWWDDTRRRYMAQVSITGPDGKRRRRTVTAPTQEAVEQRLARLQAGIAATGDVTGDVVHVSGFMTYWIDEVLPLAGVRPGTIRAYARVTRLYIDPAIGHLHLDALTVAHLRRMFTGMRQRGLSPATCDLTRSALRRALGVAVVDELVPRNVAALVGPITPDRPKRGTLTLDQARQLLDAADAAGEGALVAVMLGLGLRRGEALGLRWRDLDLEAGRLTVAGAWAVGDGDAYWEAAKAGSERTVHLPDAITRRLRTQRANQKLQRVCAGPRWHAGDWVFTGPSGQPRNPGGVTEKVKAISSDAGLGHWTPHGLRHSAASILLAMKVPLKVVSELLGHSSIRVTGDIYSHVMEPARAEAADAMQAAIFS